MPHLPPHSTPHARSVRRAHHTRRVRHLLHVLTVIVLAVLVQACGGATTVEDVVAGDAEPDLELSVAIASYDVAVGEDQRLLAGVFTSDAQLLGFGEVTFQLAHLGDQPGGQGTLSQQVTATYLPVLGMEPQGSSERPTLLEDPLTNGVYAGRVDLDEPGYWGIRVLAELADGRIGEGNAVVSVLPESLVPAAGSPAPRTENPTIADVEAGTVRPVSLDSRAQDEGAEIPDPHLHDTVIADAIDAGRPVVVMVSTPVYCVSRFCGPLVEELSQLASSHGDRADFVHLEVWEDFESQTLNDAAASWIASEAGSFEPWVFLVGADGDVLARWDNVVDRDELVALLEGLPSIGPPVAAPSADR